MNPHKKFRDVGRLMSWIRRGEGPPEGVVAAPVGTLYLNRDGDEHSMLFLKVSGNSSPVGWVAK